MSVEAFGAVYGAFQGRVNVIGARLADPNPCNSSAQVGIIKQGFASEIPFPSSSQHDSVHTSAIPAGQVKSLSLRALIIARGQGL